MIGSTLHLESRVNGNTLHLGIRVNGGTLHLEKYGEWLKEGERYFITFRKYGER